MPGALLEIVTAAIPSLAASGSGRVVAVSSFIAHKIEQPTFAPASSVAAAALEALVKCFALQLATAGITVNAVVPGFTRKDPGKQGSLSDEAWAAAAQRTPTGRLNETDEVAASIQFLLSAEARQITGALLNVDGGLTLG
jgi:3-oxoacyl-[acyl-carrier protein] reductase